MNYPYNAIFEIVILYLRNGIIEKIQGSYHNKNQKQAAFIASCN